MYRKAKPRIGDVIRANENAPYRLQEVDLTVVGTDFFRYRSGERESEYMVMVPGRGYGDSSQLFDDEVDYAPSRN